MKYFVANWKANKNLDEALRWIDIFAKQLPEKNGAKIIICPPFQLLYSLAEKIKKLKNIYLGAQDISAFNNGNFTGEVTAKMLKNLIQYSIIGHSERRKYFSETDKEIEKKVIQAKKNQIEPILCVRDEKDKIFPQVKIVAYEPVFAIGTGINESPEKVLFMKKRLNLKSNTIFLYGGSVNEVNIKKYLSTNEIDGFLIGAASLDPIRFSHIIKLASFKTALKNKSEEN